jgi:hypothetical protein
MAKKVQKPAAKSAKKPFEVNPTEFMVITIDTDFCEELAKFIQKKGTGSIAEFGEHLLDSVQAQRVDVSIEKEVEKYAAKADKFVKDVDKQVKLAAAKSAKAEKVKRERLAKKAKQLHAKGKSFRTIGKQLGVSAITAARYCKK